ncbi:hypothetical protein PsorP6_015263 [Peronosclerospora sorghi]|uniref:Uncharacterized protein n=1 Tax=Peronosclerospora sorghi TaxID=230839 RepID=A0ACC0VTG8_9STRA|nr:hypothetical protein PsorP6_015263 [Peronosclerospora sorghi]
MLMSLPGSTPRNGSIVTSLNQCNTIKSTFTSPARPDATKYLINKIPKERKKSSFCSPFGPELLQLKERLVDL